MKWLVTTRPMNVPNWVILLVGIWGTSNAIGAIWSLVA